MTEPEIPSPSYTSPGPGAYSTAEHLAAQQHQEHEREDGSIPLDDAAVVDTDSAAGETDQAGDTKGEAKVDPKQAKHEG